MRSQAVIVEDVNRIEVKSSYPKQHAYQPRSLSSGNRMRGSGGEQEQANNDGPIDPVGRLAIFLVVTGGASRSVHVSSA